MDYKILDEVLNFLNNGSITLNHVKNFTSNYSKLSHKGINDNVGFYKFHNKINEKMRSILEPYGLKCHLFGVYEDKNALVATRMCTILIDRNKNDDDYDIKVAKLMSDYKGGLITSKLNSLSNKVTVNDANYCYTTQYKIYSIDITYTINK